MLETTIRLNDGSDVGQTLKWFRQSCLASGIHDEQCDDAVETLREALKAMKERGKAAAKAKGRYNETQRIKTKTFTVTVVAEFGARGGLLGRAARWLRARRR